jgi:GH15 family glucan-1,4-alpha-glucosidase
MNGLLQLAKKTIEKNIFYDRVVAAPEGPGVDHKEYLHIWPRDSLMVALELKNSNVRLAKKIVKSVLDLPTDNGLLYQRYELDGTPDPRAWCNGDGVRQLDQDALKLVSVAEFSGLKFDKDRLWECYNSLLNNLKDKKTSTDVWEQKRGHFFYTNATLIWGLKSAEKIFPRSKKKHKKILKGLIKELNSYYDKKLKSFVKSLDERIIDLEVVLGINILFELNLVKSKKMLKRILSTLKMVEKELCVDVNGSKIPIRYKDDFWNGESVGPNGNGRPWPMGSAMISQAYSNLSKIASKLGEDRLSLKARKESKRWLNYVKNSPNIERFPEQINFDGSLPQHGPKNLTWCASEVIKANRLHSSNLKIRRKVRFKSN